MEIVLNTLKALPLILFWSAVLSYVPTVYYLLLKNPPLYKAERLREMGVFVIGQERVARKAKRSRVLTVSIIYGVCVLFFSAIYYFNACHGRTDLKPFDILSTLSIILFAFSVITYLPVAFYLLLKDPWRKKEEGLCLTGIFIGYGIGILLFSIAFARYWLKTQHLTLGLGELSSSYLVILFSSLALAYLPIAVYVLSKIANPYHPRGIHANVIFVIYSVCFVIFSSVFIGNWVVDRRLGIQTRIFYFRF